VHVQPFHVLHSVQSPSLRCCPLQIPAAVTQQGSIGVAGLYSSSSDGTLMGPPEQLHPAVLAAGAVSALHRARGACVCDYAARPACMRCHNSTVRCLTPTIACRPHSRGLPRCPVARVNAPAPEAAVVVSFAQLQIQGLKSIDYFLHSTSWANASRYPAEAPCSGLCRPS
jgi:hypothetical protein